MNSMDETQPFFRIAIRAEGASINAYFAANDSMKDAILIGSIKRSICDADKAVFTAFKELMQSAISVVIRETLGVTPEKFETVPAPESERSGSA